MGLCSKWIYRTNDGHQWEEYDWACMDAVMRALGQFVNMQFAGWTARGGLGMPGGLNPFDGGATGGGTGGTGATGTTGTTGQDSGEEDPTFAQCYGSAIRLFNDGMAEIGGTALRALAAAGGAWASGRIAGAIPLPLPFRMRQMNAPLGVGRVMSPVTIGRYAIGGTLRALGAAGAGLTLGQYGVTAAICSVASGFYE
jgi:hypothetical protein